METLWQDLRYGARSLIKKPGFTFVVTLTLALSIGANTAIFSFVNALLLRPLPYREADRLVRIASIRGEAEGRLSMLELKDLREQTPIFEGVAPYFPGAQYNYSGDGAPEELASVLVSRDLFNTLSVPLLHGGLWPESYDLERNFGVILTYDFWKRRFGGDPNYFQVSATDPLTYLVVPLLLAAVAIVACYIPARRAMKVDPMTALGTE